jgi:hypothetical protein
VTVPAPDPTSGNHAVRITKDAQARARLAEFAGLTPEERAALDQWCFDQEKRRQRGVLLHDTEPRPAPAADVDPAADDLLARLDAESQSCSDPATCIDHWCRLAQDAAAALRAAQVERDAAHAVIRHLIAAYPADSRAPDGSAAWSYTFRAEDGHLCLAVYCPTDAEADAITQATRNQP